jgi:hypothetical protein
MGRRNVTIAGVTAAVALVAGLVAPGAAAGAASTPPGPIAPGQTYFAVVNGVAVNAKVVVACSAAVRPGQKGHPVSGQTIGVRSPSPSTVPTGFTGSLGRSIVAQLVSPTPTVAAAASVVFDSYGTKALPTTWLVPCSGSGTITFNARPTSATARNEKMTVTFVAPCPGTVCAKGVGGRERSVV